MEAFKEKQIGLALSGGGHRAAVFHLGVLSYLAENGFLENVHHISTVSGGSVIMGLVYRLNDYKFPGSQEYLENVLPRVRDYFTDRSLQGRLALNALWYSIFDRHKALSYTLEKNWDIDTCIQALAPHPAWTINTTTLETGKSWQIKKERMGDYSLGGYIPNPVIKLSDAIAASAGFPFGVGPMKLDLRKYRFTPKGLEKQKKLYLYDGGVYDNLGLEPLIQHNFSSLKKGINFLIASDASKPVLKKGVKYWQRPGRLIDISTEQIRSLKKRLFYRFLHENRDQGIYIQLGQGHYGLNLEADRAKRFGTNFKQMSEEDFDSIKSNGYATAMSNFEKLIEER